MGVLTNRSKIKPIKPTTYAVRIQTAARDQTYDVEATSINEAEEKALKEDEARAEAFHLPEDLTNWKGRYPYADHSTYGPTGGYYLGG